MSPRSLSVVMLAAAAALCNSAAPANAARFASPCAGASFRSVASHSHSHISACTVQRGQVYTETTYYQNASKVGGSALAAFPEARSRYGIAPHVELFLDWPSEIAKSGSHGNGIYYMTQTGFGVKVEVARAAGVVYSLTAEHRPPMNALANMAVVPNGDVHADATWSPSLRTTATVEVGALSFTQRGIAGFSRTTPVAAFALTNEFNRKTSMSLEIGSQSLAAYGGSAQMSGTIGLQRTLSKHVQFNVELGSAFNSTGGSKPHYFGFGFITH